MSEKSLTKKLLEDVMPEEEKPKVSEYKGYFDKGGVFGDDLANDSWRDGYDGLYGSHMDDLDQSRPLWDRGKRGSSYSYNSAKQIIDSNAHGASRTITLDRHDSDELVDEFKQSLESEFSSAGIVLTQDASDELKASLLDVLDRCKWKSGVSLYDLRLKSK